MDPVVELIEASFSYPDGTPALVDVTARLEAPTAVGLTGPGGSGKSTLLKMLAGFAPGLVAGELTGQVTIFGHPPSQLDPQRRAATVGLAFSDPFQQLSGNCSTVRRELAWGLENLAVARDQMEARVERIMERTGLTQLAGRAPQALSGGQQQRVAVASILILEPKLLLLDEPLSMLDPRSAREMTSLIQGLVEGGQSVIWATSRLEEIDWCAQWWCLEKGRLTVVPSPTVEAAKGSLPAPWSRLAAAAAWEGPLPVSERQAIESFRQL